MTFSYKIAYRNRAQNHRSLRVNRSSIRFDFSAGANAIWYNVNTSHKSQIPGPSVVCWNWSNLGFWETAHLPLP